MTSPPPEMGAPSDGDIEHELEAPALTVPEHDPPSHDPVAEA
jgi:hypothetical protein